MAVKGGAWARLGSHLLLLTSAARSGFDQARFEGVGRGARPAGGREAFRHSFGARRLGDRFADFEPKAIWIQPAGRQSCARAPLLWPPVITFCGFTARHNARYSSAQCDAVVISLLPPIVPL